MSHFLKNFLKVLKVQSRGFFAEVDFFLSYCRQAIVSLVFSVHLKREKPVDPSHTCHFYILALLINFHILSLCWLLNKIGGQISFTLELLVILDIGDDPINILGDGTCGGY